MGHRISMTPEDIKYSLPANAKKYFHMAISNGQNPKDLKNAIDYYKTSGI